MEYDNYISAFGLGFVIIDISFCFLPAFFIDETIYRFRYKRLDEFCENLVKIVKEDGAHKIAGERDPVLAKVYQENPHMFKSSLD